MLNQQGLLIKKFYKPIINYKKLNKKIKTIIYIKLYNIKMKKILLATTNKAKLQELKLGIKELKKIGFKILTLNDVRVEKEPEETGKTFCENARIKARFYGKLTNLPTIADDGGLLIPYLNNEPGVKSRRWLGYEASDEELINHTLKSLHGINEDCRLAYLQTCLCYFEPNSNCYFCETEKIKGWIAQKTSGKPTDGYPFRALFIVQQFNKYYDELTEAEHNKINHRRKALKRLIKKIKKFGKII